jgi:hypothetical protein
LACHLQIDADPDQAHHFDADPDADTDPAYHFDADPDADSHPYPNFQFDADPCGSGYTTLAVNTEKGERRVDMVK